MDTRIPLVLKEISGYGNQRVRQLLDVYSRKPVALDELFPWIKETIGSKNLKLRIPESDEVHQAIERAMKRLDQSAEHGVELVTWLNPLYPERLRHIPSAPVYFFYKGNYDCIRRDLGVAIIGTREVTEYGSKIAKRLGYLFGSEGYTVFSGLAIGCDQLAHEGCLEAEGRTVAILPCGLDMVVPEKNTRLAQKILDGKGCLVSEYPIGMKPAKNTYVERDRLQSGFSKGILVVETDVEGGTMHTVGFAEKQGRLIACHQHPEKYLQEPKTRGNQKLIREKRAMAISDKETLKAFMEKLNQDSGTASLSSQGGTDRKKDANVQLEISVTEASNKLEGVILDLDQTLIDSSNALHLRKKRQWKEVYEKIPEFNVYPGVHELINMLKAKRIPVCIVSSSPKTYCQEVLNYWKVDIPNLVCYHDTQLHKPHPEPMLEAVQLIGGHPSRIIAVGDHEMDTQAAKQAGIIAVGALWGSLDKEKLINSKPDHAFDEVRDLKMYIESLK